MATTGQFSWPSAGRFHVRLGQFLLSLARLGDTGSHWTAKQHNFDPHILSDALRRLRALGGIDSANLVTKGGTTVAATFLPTEMSNYGRGEAPRQKDNALSVLSCAQSDCW
jgi:hypothetical protein